MKILLLLMVIYFFKTSTTVHSTNTNDKAKLRLSKFTLRYDISTFRNRAFDDSFDNMKKIIYDIYDDEEKSVLLSGMDSLGMLYKNYNPNTPLLNFKYCKSVIIFSIIAYKFQDINKIYIHISILLFGTLFDSVETNNFSLPNDMLLYTTFCICEFLNNFLEQEIIITKKTLEKAEENIKEKNAVFGYILIHLYKKIRKMENKNILNIGNLLKTEFNYLYKYSTFSVDNGLLAGCKDLLSTAKHLSAQNPYQSQDYISNILNQKTWISKFNDGINNTITEYVEMYLKCSNTGTILPALYILNINSEVKVKMQHIFKNVIEYTFSSKLAMIIFAINCELYDFNFDDKMAICILQNVDECKRFNNGLIDQIKQFCPFGMSPSINISSFSFAESEYNHDDFVQKFKKIYNKIKDKDKDEELRNFYRDYIKNYSIRDSPLYSKYNKCILSGYARPRNTNSGNSSSLNNKNFEHSVSTDSENMSSDSTIDDFTGYKHGKAIYENDSDRKNNYINMLIAMPIVIISLIVSFLMWYFAMACVIPWIIIGTVIICLCLCLI
ncbi:hypothetical protein TCON_1414 [Astathelohania contejeani]|uniref:Uncharacterized protein n=1 Tax=Astathelohania contejeani TaxID=164912 RepID=A0ABQ7HYZ5_9MICR|nr:hypothetical protein TCON_1414 [Thelohania contejeani]